jgi:DNA ligase-1
MSISDIIAKIKSTAGASRKTLIKENLSVLSPIFEDTYSDAIYGVLKYSVLQQGTKTLDENYPEFHALLGQLSRRELTGDAAVSAVEQLVGQFAQADQLILDGILQHNLKIGITAKGYFEIAHPGEFWWEVALAKNLKDVKGVNPIDGTYLASRKLDGVRCICTFEVNDNKLTFVEFKSRTGHVFNTLGNLVPFIEKIASVICDNERFVFDGECCIIDENGNEDFQSIMKVISKKDYTIENPSYRVFDLLTEKEFQLKEKSEIFSVRYNTICNLFDCVKRNANIDAREFDKHIQALKQERITTEEDFLKWKGYVAQYNWEGFMLRKDIPYENGRSKSLIKIKEFDDQEFVVNSIETGLKTYAEAGVGYVDYPNCCTGLNITFKGNTVTVGSGITKEQSLRWAEHPEEIVGKTITVQYFEETIDSKTNLPSLRFPVLKAIYNGPRET